MLVSVPIRPTTVPAALVPILGELKEGLESVYGGRLEALYLFGSAARGDARPHSDIDVAVIVRGYDHREPWPTEISELTHGLWRKCGRPVGCLLFDAEEFATTEETIVENIRAEGIRFK